MYIRLGIVEELIRDEIGQVHMRAYGGFEDAQSLAMTKQATVVVEAHIAKWLWKQGKGQIPSSPYNIYSGYIKKVFYSIFPVYYGGFDPIAMLRQSKFSFVGKWQPGLRESLGCLF